MYVRLCVLSEEVSIRIATATRARYVAGAEVIAMHVDMRRACRAAFPRLASRTPLTNSHVKLSQAPCRKKSNTGTPAIRCAAGIVVGALKLAARMLVMHSAPAAYPAGL
eukprot:TRINITY_DN14128_c0_g1_i2.p5 TRINITY_DN14128_c0_g1~~TRINITY_DN14128_c0_g1_i2.p5  ORF type:complete len:109 (-),score=6.32 TRINITY_DN14128_c0_g1_i2:314-640(-)